MAAPRAPSAEPHSLPLVFLNLLSAEQWNMDDWRPDVNNSWWRIPTVKILARSLLEGIDSSKRLGISIEPLGGECWFLEGTPVVFCLLTCQRRRRFTRKKDSPQHHLLCESAGTSHLSRTSRNSTQNPSAGGDGVIGELIPHLWVI